LTELVLRKGSLAENFWLTWQRFFMCRRFAIYPWLTVVLFHKSRAMATVRASAPGEPGQFFQLQPVRLQTASQDTFGLAQPARLMLRGIAQPVLNATSVQLMLTHPCWLSTLYPTPICAKRRPHCVPISVP
jgi:hypothetical protein